MDFDLTAEQVMLQQGAQRYVREHPGVAERRALSASHAGFSPARWAHFAELGWLALLIPEDAGGLGATDIELALLMEELGRGPSAEPLPDTAILGTTLIQACTWTVLRNDLLSGIAAGTFRTALAHVEPEGRSEYDTSIATRAESNGNTWRITGIKHRVMHGPAATHWLVSARVTDGTAPANGSVPAGTTAPADGTRPADAAADGPARPDATAPALFVIEANAPGVSANSYSLIDGSRACDLTFTATPALLLLTPEQAPILELALDRTIVALAAGAVGSMEAVMTLCAEHLKQRTQFGQALSKFQALQHRMAEMFIETDQARSMVYQALAALESTDPQRRRRAVSGAKWLVSRAGHFVTSQGIQLHGGVGITEEYPVSHHYRSMLIFEKRLGEVAFHLNRSAGLAQGPR
jgi:alkylation response protein AidB-like acyl-CoA dehydrogenase